MSDTEVDFCLSEKTCLKEMKAVVSTLLQDNEEPNKLTDLPFLTSTAKKEKTKRRKWNIGDFVKKPCRQRKVKWSVKNFLEESCDSVGALPFASNNSLTDDSGIHGDLPDIENTPNNSVSSDIADPISDTEDGDKHKRPGRYCIFCGKIRQKLTRHIKLKHGKEERVKAALEKSKKEKDKLFAEMRWDGIIEFNKHQATLDEPTYQSEKKGKNSSPLTRCSFCNITVVKSNFSRHKLRCSLKTNEPVASIPNSLFQVPHLSNYDKEFQTNVLAKLRIDKIGEICRTDENILQIASKFFWKVKQKKDKLNEICKGIRGDMRRLAYLYVIFREEEGIVYHHGNSLDMFNRRNYELLAKAIEKYVAKDNSEDIKAGLKLNLCFLIKRATEDLKNHFYACAKDDEGKEMNKFIATFKAWEKHLFGDATYQINKQRQVNLRKPAKLPLEEDLSKLRTHLISRIEELCSEFEFNDKHAYVELRDAACTRLTLLNGRRGGEPARLMLKDWQDAESNAWIDQQRLKSLDNADQQLVKSMKISYMTGKGNNHLVPVLIPPDTVPAITKLASSPFRKAAGVMQTNKFLFASSQNSSSHVSGWHAMNKLCRKLSLSSTDQLIATNNRHRISTLFASLDLPRQDRELFFSHMGHSEKINQDTYQAPLAIHTITKVGKHLLQIDSGEQQVAPQCNDQLPEDSKSHKGEQTLTQCNDQLLNKPKNSNGELPNEEQRISLCNDQLPNNSKNYKGKSYGLRKKAEKVLTNNVLNSDSDTDYVVSQEDNGIAYDVGNDWHTLKESKGRNYRQWNKEIGNKLFVSFGNFIKRKESSWPGREEINKFIKENELELSYYNVRTKLTNERVKWDRLHKAKSTKTKQRLKELNLH
ncbi:uncharacterized protein LOC130621949 isoform X3 [Hydractinia symbiolongicarpus]|uniref:uncharacterized protein LOC130621949 isoform X3 n=1 Tax=Hydractinia symbiolongicarpus TaxID=13093 RepID=UPI00254E1689|nr:uncharacterized protein LOC130621949 isoform X3 [Hydractinia symbiolongicarpus]